MATEVSAILKGVRLSPQKARLVADLVRGKKVDYALNILNFSPKKGAEIIKRVVESAIANAEHNNGADIDELFIKTIYVDKGIILKRIRARAKGRAGKITKPTINMSNQISLIDYLEDKEADRFTFYQNGEIVDSKKIEKLYDYTKEDFIYSILFTSIDHSL